MSKKWVHPAGMPPKLELPESVLKANRIGEIYGLRLGDSKVYRYVGMTRRGARNRFNGHRALARRNSEYPVSRWISKHYDEVVFDVLERCDVLDMPLRECCWIDKIKPDLNMAPGGYGTSATQVGRKVSLEVRARMSASKKGRKQTPEFVARRTRALKGQKRTDAQKAAIKIAFLAPNSCVGCRKEFKSVAAFMSHHRIVHVNNRTAPLPYFAATCIGCRKTLTTAAVGHANHYRLCKKPFLFTGPVGQQVLDFSAA